MKTKLLQRVLSIFILLSLVFNSTGRAFAAPSQANTCPPEIGDGASSDAVKQSMCDAFVRNGGFGGVGQINTTNAAAGKVHNWAKNTVEDKTDYQIQDFAGGSDDPTGATLIYTPAWQKAFFVRGQILLPYLELNKKPDGSWDPDHDGVRSWLGGPISDIGGVPDYYYDFNSSQMGLFEHGFIANHKTMGWSAHTYYPALCGMQVNVSKDGDKAKITVSTTATRTFGYPGANDATDPFDVYFVIVFPDGRRELHLIQEQDRTSFSTVISGLTLNEKVHFYFDAKKRNDNKYSTYPSRVVLNPMYWAVFSRWFIPWQDDWFGSTDSPIPLPLEDGKKPILFVDNFLCGGGLVNPPPPPLPDLTVLEVAPVQAVYNSNFDSDSKPELILHKPLAVRVKVKIDKAYLIPDDRKISIKVSFQEQNATQDFKASELKNEQPVYVNLKDKDTPNTIKTDAPVLVDVDSGNNVWEEDEENNYDEKVKVDIVQTHGFSINYIRIGIGDFETDSPFPLRSTSSDNLKPPTIEDALSFKIKSENFMDSVFPIAPSDINHNLLDNSFTFTKNLLSDEVKKSCENAKSDKIDLRFDCALYLVIFAESQAKSERIVGFVPKKYLGDSLFGYTFGPNSPVVVVGTHASDRTVAHEMGHTYGLPDKGSDHDAHPLCQDNQVDGYWVFNNTQPEKFDMMCSGVDATSNHVEKGWIIPDDYRNILYPNFTTPSIVSTPSIIMTGSVSAQRQVSIFGPYFSSDGKPAPTGENLDFETLDIVGGSIGITSFGLFNHEVSSGKRSEIFESPIFTFAAPFPDEAVYAQILDKGENVYKFNMHTSLLIQAIKSVPDEAFVKHAKQPRNTLYNEIDALEKQYERADINGVINHLEAIRKFADKWLDPAYQASMEIEYSHDKVISLIDELLRRLKNPVIPPTPTPTPTPTNLSASFYSNGTNDGWLLEKSEKGNVGVGTGPASKSLDLRAGDDKLNRQYRSILSFDTTSLPENAEILSATLKLKAIGTQGANPLNTHGKLLLDIQKGSFGLPRLQSGDFQLKSSLLASSLLAGTSLGNLRKDAGGWYTFNLSQSSLAVINKAGLTQFRLRFALDDDNDKVQDIIRFYSGDFAQNLRPMLSIIYRLP